MASPLLDRPWREGLDLSAEAHTAHEDAIARVEEARVTLRRARQLNAHGGVLGEITTAEHITDAARSLRAALVVLGAAAYERARPKHAAAAEPARRDAPDGSRVPLRDTMPSPEPVAVAAPPTPPPLAVSAPHPSPSPAQSPPPPPLPPRSAAPVTSVDLTLLQAAFNNRSLSSDTPQAPSKVEAMIQQRKRAADIARASHVRLGPTPERLRKKADIEREVDVLVEAGGQLGAWSQLDPDANHALTAWMSHRMRAAQREVRRRDLHACALKLDRLFQVVCAHSKRSRPGPIHGLARDHVPERGHSWLSHAQTSEARVLTLFQRPSTPGPDIDDALRQLTEDVKTGMDAATFAQRAEAIVALGASQHHTRLVRLAQDHASLLPDTLADLRRAALAEQEADLEDATEPPTRLLKGWSLLPVTQGKTAVIVGGDPRPERLARIREAFGFSAVDWLAEDSASGARLNSLTQRMRHGTVDVVIMMRAFSSHTLTDRVFGLSDHACTVILSDSYGIQQIRLAFERYAQPSPQV